jgi:hypothetical protein
LANGKRPDYGAEIPKAREEFKAYRELLAKNREEQEEKSRMTMTDMMMGNATMLDMMPGLLFIIISAPSPATSTDLSLHAGRSAHG